MQNLQKMIHKDNLKNGPEQQFVKKKRLTSTTIRKTGGSERHLQSFEYRDTWGRIYVSNLTFVFSEQAKYVGSDEKTNFAYQSSDGNFQSLSYPFGIKEYQD